MIIETAQIGTAERNEQGWDNDSSNLTVTVPGSGVPLGATIVIASSADVPLTPLDDMGSPYLELVHMPVTPAPDFGVWYLLNCPAMPAGTKIMLAPTGTQPRKTAMTVFSIIGGGVPNLFLTQQGDEAAVLAAGFGFTGFTDHFMVGLIATTGPRNDAFDLRAGWVPSPTRIGTQGGPAAKNVTIAGGSKIVTVGAERFGAAIRERPWKAAVVAFPPA